MQCTIVLNMSGITIHYLLFSVAISVIKVMEDSIIMVPPVITPTFDCFFVCFVKHNFLCRKLELLEILGAKTVRITATCERAMV